MNAEKKDYDEGTIGKVQIQTTFINSGFDENYGYF